MHPQQPQQWPPQQPYAPPPPPQQWQPPPPPPPAKKSGAKTVVIIGAVIVALAVVGIAIGASGGEEPGPAASTSSAQPTSGAQVPSPDADQAAAYLDALRAIDPGLVANEERAIRRAVRVCERIIAPPEGSTMSLERYVVAELSGGNATITTGQARQVIKAVKAWCR
ncbi:hypothetical protein [Microbispora sp. NPDC049633]|uniref:hypothetical protein n=1 Tax=Microbispora sp. NPDC049633 TaxID=3154355 RepID=UPI00341532A2